MEPTSTNGLSPLDQIRLAEAEMTRKIITAREASESAIAEGHLHASLLKKQARESGIRAGQIRRREIVSQAEEEAVRIVEQARVGAGELRRKGNVRMEQAIQATVAIVLGGKVKG